jgi:hypothetical protein
VEAVGLLLVLPEGKDVEGLVEIEVDVAGDARDRRVVQGEIVAFLDRTQNPFVRYGGGVGGGRRRRRGARGLRRGFGPIVRLLGRRRFGFDNGRRRGYRR